MVLRNFIAALCTALVLFACSGGSAGKESSDEDTLPVTENKVGQKLFSENCAQCHGNDGKLGASGASDLSSSTLEDDELTKVIIEGRNAMPGMGPILGKKKSINAVVEYVKELRK